MRMLRTVWMVVGALCAVALIAAGCSKNGASTSRKQAEQQVKSLPGTDMISAPRGQVRPGGTLRIAIIDYPQNFNSYNILGNDAALIPLDQTTLPRFFTVNEAGDPVLDKDYATSAKITSRDPFTVTFQINPKAVWSDGKPIGYQDFVSAWKANNGDNQAFKIASSNGWEQISSITRGSSDREIKVVFSEPYAGWTGIFNGLKPASLTATPKAFNTAWQKTRPVSGGPFIITSADSTSQLIIEKPNPRWWGAKPKLSQIAVRSLAQKAQVGAFNNGELDALSIGTDADNLKQAESVADTKILRASGAVWYHLDLNGRTPLLANATMRRAIFQGVDRAQIARSRLAPVGAPAVLLRNHMYMPTQSGYQRNDGTVSYNPAAAKMTLDGLGWKMDGRYRKKNGRTLTVRMVGQADNAVQAQVGQQVLQSLAGIGVNVQLVTVPKDDFFAKYVDTGDYDMAYYGWTGDPYPECSEKSIFALGGAQNHTFVSDRAIGELFDKACSTLDPAMRHALGNELDTKLSRLASVVPIFALPNIGAVKNDLVNYDEDSSAFQTPVWTDVGFRKN